ncbi:MAG: hypothetical protein SAK29_00500 [Scytonema sp. PMC 1069.18]|nr:hypothetical protein [Scytonema sp. PMC 1069.18]MEC4882597.1 hypothetical protein [Scytonema sp. PMC 1070.18]
MHKISEQTAKAAQKHAYASLKHGEILEEIGKKLQKGDRDEQELGQHMEAYGKMIENQAQQGIASTERLEEDNSTEVFLESVQEHINASLTHIEAAKEFISWVKDRVDESSSTPKF